MNIVVLLSMMMGVLGTVLVQTLHRLVSRRLARRKWNKAGEVWKGLLDDMDNINHTPLYDYLIGPDGNPHKAPVGFTQRFNHLVSRIYEGDPVNVKDTVALLEKRRNISDIIPTAEHTVAKMSRTFERTRNTALIEFDKYNN